MSKVPLGIAYFVAASLAVALTRYDGGVAFLWIACALADRRPVARRRARAGPDSLVPCMVASVAATGLFGLGWTSRAAVRAAQHGRGGRSRHGCSAAIGGATGTLGSLAWLVHFVARRRGSSRRWSRATMAGMILWWMGRPVLDGFVDVFDRPCARQHHLHAAGDAGRARPRVAQARRRRAAHDAPRRSRCCC